MRWLIITWICFWTLHSISLINVSILILANHSLSYLITLAFIMFNDLFLFLILAILSPLNFHINFRIRFHKNKTCGILVGIALNIEIGFRKTRYSNNIESSSPWTWYFLPFTVSNYVSSSRSWISFSGHFLGIWCFDILLNHASPWIL